MGWEDRELDDLLYRLNKLDKMIPKDEKKTTGEGSGERFDDLSIDFIDRCHRLRKAIKDAQDMKANGGGSAAGMTRARDNISAQQNIRVELRELSKEFTEMENIQAKELKKKKSKIPKDKLELRNQHLRQFAYQLELMQQLAQRGYIGAQASGADAGIGPGSSMYMTQGGLFTGINNVAHVGAGASGAGIAKSVGGANHAYGGTSNTGGISFANLKESDGSGGAGGGGSEMTEGQKQALAQIELENQKQDQILDEISKTILEAGQMARKINELSKKQGEMLDNLDTKVQKVSDKMHTVNVRLKEQMESHGMSMERVCVNLVCCVLLLGVVAVIINLVTQTVKV